MDQRLKLVILLCLTLLKWFQAIQLVTTQVDRLKAEGFKK